MERTLGDHPRALVARNNIANCMQHMGRDDAARELRMRAIQDGERLLGHNHPIVLSMYGSDALLKQRLQRPTEAMALYQCILGRLEEGVVVPAPTPPAPHASPASAPPPLSHQVLGGSQEDQQEQVHERERLWSDSLMGLAQCLITLGRPTEALPLLERAAALASHHWGMSHSSTLRARTALGWCLMRLNTRLEEALGHFQHGMAAGEGVWGKQHPEYFTARDNVAQCLQRLGRDAEALPLFQQSLQQVQQHYSEGSPPVLSALSNLATCMLGAGQAQDAEALFHKVLQAVQHAVPACQQGPTSQATAPAQGQITGINSSSNNNNSSSSKPTDVPPQAAESRMQSIAFVATNGLARCKAASGQAAEGLVLAHQNLASSEASLGPNSPIMLASLEAVAACLAALGRKADAVSMLQRAHTGWLAADDPVRADKVQRQLVAIQATVVGTTTPTN